MGRKKKEPVNVEDVEQGLKNPKQKEVKIPKFVSSGCTILDLALSDKLDGGYLLGSFVNVIGDSSSGKSMLALTMCAEAVRNKSLNDYSFIYDLPEATMNFDLESMFGSKFEKMIFLPEDRTRARTIQEWHHDLYRYSSGPIIQVTDSFDALTAIGDVDAVEAGNAVAKTGWKTEKAVVSSAAFPQIIGRIEEHNSLLFIISQVRSNIGVSFGPSKKQAGGYALEFYRTHALWLSEGKKITVSVREKDREIGHWTHCKITKNKVTGKIRQISFPVYYDYGIDDIGASIEWMINEGFWGVEKRTGKLTLAEEDYTSLDIDPEKKLVRSSIIKHIENKQYEGKLKQIVGECWSEVENEIKSKIDRKPKYWNDTE